MKKTKEQTKKNKVARRRLGFLFLTIFVGLGLISAASEIVFQYKEALDKQTFPISEGLADAKPLVVPPLNQNNGPAFIKQADAVVASQAGFSLRVPVLMYHYVRDGVPASDKLGQSLSVSPANFEQQMNYLASNGYQTITPTDLYFALVNKSPLPAKAIVLTFDDGYRDFYLNAYPILKKYQLRSTVFMIADWIGRDAYLTEPQLKQMHSEGLVDVESHTLNHVSLPSIPLEQARAEIVQSKQKLESLLGKKVMIFCYPYGFYNATVAQMVVDAGYVMAFSTRYGSSENDREMFYLRRVRIYGPDSLGGFISRVSQS